MRENKKLMIYMQVAQLLFMTIGSIIVGVELGWKMGIGIWCLAWSLMPNIIQK